MTKQTNGGWVESIPQVDIELLQGGSVLVTDTADMNGVQSVQLHPVHLRLIAEKLGFVREVSASEADSLRAERGRTADALRRVVTLQRQMLKLRDRIDHLGEYLALYSDSKHADLSYEQTYATATADICEEFVADFDDGESDTLPDGVLWEGSNGTRQYLSAASMAEAKPHAHPAEIQPVSGGTNPATDWALRQPLGKSSAKFLLVLMAFNARETGECCSSTAELAQTLGQDRKTVMENIKHLAEIGLIVDTGRKGGPTKAIPVFSMAWTKEYVVPKTEQLSLEGAQP